MKKIISLLLTFCLPATMVCLEIPSFADTSEYICEIDGHPITVIANGCFYQYGCWFHYTQREKGQEIFFDKERETFNRHGG